MGIFDTVEGKFFCPLYGARIKEFQVKDLKSSVALFEVKLPIDVSFPSREMHTSCKECGSWISINVGEANLKQPR